jgi:hypothetical protein
VAARSAVARVVGVETSNVKLRRAFFDEFEPGNANFAFAAAPLTGLTAGEAPGDSTKGESASKAGEEGDSAMVKRTKLDRE